MAAYRGWRKTQPGYKAPLSKAEAEELDAFIDAPPPWERKREG